MHFRHFLRISPTGAAYLLSKTEKDGRMIKE
jgi:hypothetical protein